MDSTASEQCEAEPPADESNVECSVIGKADFPNFYFFLINMKQLFAGSKWKLPQSATILCAPATAFRQLARHPRLPSKLI